MLECYQSSHLACCKNGNNYISQNMNHPFNQPRNNITSLSRHCSLVLTSVFGESFFSGTAVIVTDVWCMTEKIMVNPCCLQIIFHLTQHLCPYTEPVRMKIAGVLGNTILVHRNYQFLLVVLIVPVQ